MTRGALRRLHFVPVGQRRDACSRTSIHYGAVAVEDHPALIQGGNRVQEVEGPQIPLISAVKTNNDRDGNRNAFLTFDLF